MRFQSPQLGALGVTFTALRAAQFLSLVTIVGLTANFINEFASSQREVPDVLVGTVTVTSIATLYVAISYILYYDGMLPLLVAGGADFALLVALIVVAVTIGKPLSMLQCQLLPESVSTTETFVTYITGRGYSSAAARYNSYLALITTDQPHCYEIKAVWGLGIALSVLFAFSAIGYAGVRGGFFGAAPPPPVQQISGPMALGTRLLSPGIGSRYPPPLSLPQASYRRPVVHGAADDYYNDVPHHVLPPPATSTNDGNIVNSRLSRGRSLTLSIPPPPPTHLLAVEPPSQPTPSPQSSSHEDYIPILHQPVLKYGKTPAKTPTLVVVPPPSPSDDGFTPVTPPTPSPRTKAFKRIRVSQLPRDALGIAAAGFSRRKSQRGEKVEEPDEETMPLSPPYDAQTMDAQVAVKAKPTRKTLFGVLEGWWDLGLLERGRSLRRK
ncbi:hypothetical protein F5B22DRAFT_649386 [Xylaria bambusicola]|uniref:uncharacterized protein n=1 Tax=Xylaria bambusicola TaxID=326684 RepID=UPI002008E6EB|nr:uncharacterized protein F5B22DRAFT_649386 [Xylaria bambusicola]KAI0509111.1 hypothetical protein F5B22DRAFT_649386 [Xylaria bambusicola]